MITRVTSRGRRQRVHGHVLPRQTLCGMKNMSEIRSDPVTGPLAPTVTCERCRAELDRLDKQEGDQR